MRREQNELSLPSDKLEDKGDSIKDSLLQFFLTLLSKHSKAKRAVSGVGSSIKILHLITQSNLAASI